MKKIILFGTICVSMLLQATAQINKTNVQPVSQSLQVAPMADSKMKTSCCAANPYVLTACSQSLFQSFKNLASGTGVHNCHPSLNYPSVSYAMPENCFSYLTTGGIVTYTSFYIPGVPEFRVIWGEEPGNFSYYGACAPDPIIFTHTGGTYNNHVFAAKLIKQSDYRAFTGSPKNYTNMAAVPSIAVSDIQQITAVYMEENGGYISTSEAVDYNNLYSSKGIVANVKLRSGTSVLCYLINNYDNGGTIIWKEKNPACIK